MSIYDEFDELLQQFSHMNYIRPSMLPHMELYMDQVLTFMEERIGTMRRNTEDKILTKTMINNYTKNKLLPPPVKKKYTDEHLLLLNYIYYLKSILSISDIQTLLKPMTEEYWGRGSKEEVTMKNIYRDLLSLEHNMYRSNIADVKEKMDLASESFSNYDLSDEERDYLQHFALVAMLAFDVSMKKRMMEAIVDNLKEKK